ncbi:MAG TPA: hypothetical protein ENN69_03395, partial [Spirochaetia bacterium]|nr:hypothetical protein [Spirochaetia bacterium]
MISRGRIVGTAVLISIALLGCDLLMDTGDHANVGIDLSGFFGEGSGRAVSFPQGIACTGIKVSVFGPGMQPMNKTVSPGTKYINLYVPAGRDRHFTLEIFFDITDPGLFVFTHVRSFKGRATADLRPGMFTGLKFKLTAGSTTLLIPDYGSSRIWEAEDIS